MEVHTVVNINNHHHPSTVSHAGNDGAVSLTKEPDGHLANQQSNAVESDDQEVGDVPLRDAPPQNQTKIASRLSCGPDVHANYVISEWLASGPTTSLIWVAIWLLSGVSPKNHTCNVAPCRTVLEVHVVCPCFL